MPTYKISQKLKNFILANYLALRGLAKFKVKKIRASKNISSSVIAVV